MAGDPKLVVAHVLEADDDVVLVVEVDDAVEVLRQGAVAGGLLVQSRDNAVVDEMQLKAVTKRAPSAAELRRWTAAAWPPRRRARGCRCARR